MRVAAFTVHRPIFTTMVTLIVVLLGLVSLYRLSIDLMPEVTYPTITVATRYDHASPEEVEELITRPLEQAVSAVPGAEEITSISAEGISNVRIAFTWGTDLDVASNDIRDLLDRIINVLPDEADRPMIRKFDLAAFPVLIMGVSGRLDPLELRRMVDDHIAHRIERVPGVAVLDIWGGLEREVQVEVDAAKLQAIGLSLDEVRTAIQAANLSIPAGEIERGHFEVTLRTPGYLVDLDELRELVVAVRDRAPTYLHQIAKVRDTHKKVDRIIRVNGEPGVRLAVRKQSGANTVQVAEAVLQEVERINRDFPQLRMVPIIDTSAYIKQAIRNLGRVILYGGALAVMVLLFFLRNLRSTLVVATAIPTAIIATFALVYFGGFTLNLMTLGGLALGVGMMVDNGIVVLENIQRQREQGASDARGSAISGTEQVAAAVIASTLTTMAIFLPLLFAREMAGALFQQMALVVSFALVCSLLTALTLVPMLASRLAGGAREEGRWARALRRPVERVERAYGRALKGLLSRRGWVVFTTAGVFGASLLLAPRIGVELMPPADEGEVGVTVEAEPGTRLGVLDRQMRRIEEIALGAVPEARASGISIGPSTYRPGNVATGELRLSLVPMAERSRSSQEIADELRKRLSGIAGVTLRARAGHGVSVLRLATGYMEDNLQIEVRGHELDILDAVAEQVLEAVMPIEGVADVRLSRRSGAPQELLRIDRARAADLGVSVELVARTLETALGGTEVSEYRTGGEEVPIRLKVQDSERLSLDEILDFTLTNADGELVVLRNVVATEPATGPVQVERRNQQRIATVVGSISGRPLGAVVADIQEALRSVPLPRNFEIYLAGDYEEQQKAFAELLVSLVLALLLVYMVMASLYESLRDPLVVMFSVPLAVIGVILVLYLTDTTFNVQSFIGCIMLVGIVVNNAILIVDQATRLRREQGIDAVAAVTEAGRRRLRPILMTSLTTMLALLPLALGAGEGGEAQAPLARAVIGGLSSATFVTLLFIPVVYTLFHRGTDEGSKA